MRTHMILIALLLAACSSGGYVPPTSTPARFNGDSLPQGPGDLGEQLVDLSSAPPDLGSQTDLTSATPDLAMVPDFATVPPDLASSPDLATPPADMSAPPDGCFVKLAPATALPIRLTEGTYSWALGEVPRPELGADVLLQFTRVDKLFYRYRVVLGDASCAPGCPTWVHESYGPGSYNYSFHSTSGWRRPVLTIEVPNDATLDLKAVELTVPCR